MISNLPKNRPSIVRVCDQLEGQLVDKESISINDLTVLQQKDTEIQWNHNEVQRKNAEIQCKVIEIQRKDT